MIMIRKSMYVLAALVLAVAAAALVAQAPASSQESPSRMNRSYLVKLPSGQEEASDWRDRDLMHAYAKDHAGTYVVFLSEGTLYRIDQPAQMRELENLYEPIHALNQQQAALSAAQRPLSEQQKELSEVQRNTTEPSVKGRIGSIQGDLGREQGVIGRQQGVIGRQQGLLARNLYDRVQDMIDVCLREKSCAAVPSVASAQM
jgi:hypothetical protein